VPNHIVIPTSDIVLVYLVIPSNATVIMLNNDQNYNISISYLYREPKNLDSLKIGRTDLGFRTEVYDLIESPYEDEMLTRLEDSLKKFYKITRE